MADDITVLVKAANDAIVTYDALAPLSAPTTQADMLADYPDRYKDGMAVASAAQAVLDAYYSDDALVVMPDLTAATSDQTVSDPISAACVGATPQVFQGLEFHDGSSYGSLNVYQDHVDLLLDQVLTLALDCTKPHTFRLVGQGDDVSLYVDGQLALDGTGMFTRPASDRLIEFGSRNSKDEVSWETFRYSVDGPHAPQDVQDYVYEEVGALPDGGVGRMKAYSDMLYVSLDPNDPSRSSEVYRYDEGQPDEERSVLAVTKSNVTCVLVDPNRDGNMFGTTGKFLGSDKGLQYVLGSKPYPYDQDTEMEALPDEDGWELEDNCDGNCASLFGGVLTVDTRSEVGSKYWKYVQRKKADPWITKASNDQGWTVEARVRIGDDGTSSFPEDQAATSPYLARDVVLVIASSSSMETEDKLVEARRSAEMILGQLRGQDRLAVVSYGTSIQVLDPSFLDATQDNVQAAIQFVNALLPQGGSDMLGAMTRALAYTFSTRRKVIVLLTDGKSDTNPYSVLASVKATNAAGPKANINVLTFGTALLSQYPVYKYLVEQLSAQNNGITSYVLQTEVLDEKVLLFWRGAGGPVYDYESGAPAPQGGTLDQRTAFLASGDKSCEAAQPPAANVGIAPADDDMNAPGILINDGTYQEVAQFFRNGVRLKYAKLFGKVNLSGQFQNVRIIGKGTAIAVYSKADSDPFWKRIILAPEGLYVRAFGAGDQEVPTLAVDGMGFAHAVWQDSRDGNWAIYYSKTSAQDITEKGSGLFSPTTAVGLDLLKARVGFGLPAAAKLTLDDLKANKRVVLSNTATFLSSGVKQGDSIAIFGKEYDENKNIVGNLPPALYKVQRVLDEWILVLDSDVADPFSYAEYIVYRGVADWLPPVRVSPQDSDSNNPSILLHSSGDAYVAYDNDSTGFRQVYATRCSFDPSYVTVNESVKVTSSSSSAAKPAIAELPSGDLLLAWEDSRNDATRSQILASVVPVADFGTSLTTCYPAKALTDAAFTSKNPRLATLGDFVVAAYQNDANGQFDAYAVPVAGDASLAGYPVRLSLEGGASTNPALVATATGFLAAWENDYSGRPEIHARFMTVALGAQGGSVITLGDFAVVTSSRTGSTNPSIAVNPSSPDIIPIVHESDRIREGYPDLYVSRYDVGTKTWFSSGGVGMDVRLEAYMTSCRRPSVTMDAFGRLTILFEATKDGAPTKVAMVAYDDWTTSMDNYAVAYFPLDDDAGNTDVVNRINMVMPAQTSTTGGSAPSVGEVLAGKKGVASCTTNQLHVNPLDPNASLLAPEAQGAFDLLSKKAFSIDKTLLGTRGAIEFWMKPHWSSAYTTDRVLFGNDNPSATTANTLGLARIATGLRLKAVDQNGQVHSTEIPNASLSWLAEDLVHVRAIWDANAQGISSMNDVFFLTLTSGFACGQAGRLFSTADGGATWSEVQTGVTYELYSIDFPTASVGYVSGEMGTILKTVDGGATWQQSTVAGVDEDIRGLFFRTALVGYAVGTNGLILRTADGGVTWAQVVTSAVSDFRSVGRVVGPSSSAVVAVGAGGQIYRSKDDGVSYAPVTGVTWPVAAMDCNRISRSHDVAAHESYVACNQSVVLTSLDAGATWVGSIVSFGLGYSPNALGVSHGPDSDFAYVVGQNGVFAKTSDGGATWTSCQTAMSNGSFNAIDANFSGLGTNLGLVAVGSGGSVMTSADAGATQDYAITKSGNLVIQLNGVELPQSRVGDVPFSWQPNLKDLFFGDWRFNDGALTAGAAFDELYVYKDCVPNLGSVMRRKTPSMSQSDRPRLIHRPEMEKRIEWGATSELSKTSSYWMALKMFLCGAKEPLQCFAWTTQLGLVDDVVRDLAIGAGRVWVATDNGISGFDLEAATQDIEDWLEGRPPSQNASDRFVNFSNLYDRFPANSISSISVDGDGNIWAGTSKGVMVIPSVATTYESSGADVLPVSGAAAQAAVQPPRAQLSPTICGKEQGLASDNVLVVRAYGDNIYVGTDGGMTAFAKSQDQKDASKTKFDFASYYQADGLPSNYIQSLAKERKSGDLWVGTDAGVARFSTRGTVTYDVSSGLVDNNAYSITLDVSDNKYVGTGYGITKISGTTLQNFLPSQGVGAGAVVSGSVDLTGTRWFASSLGLLEMNDSCGTVFARYSFQDGLLGDPAVVDFQRYRLLGGPLPDGGCEKAMVSLKVNGALVGSGYDVVPWVPMIVLDEPLQASDLVEVTVRYGWRKVYDFSGGIMNPNTLATVEAPLTKMFVYRSMFPAGQVILGGNSASGLGNQAKMYAVFATPLTVTPLVISASRPAGANVVVAAKGNSLYSDSSVLISILPGDVSGGWQIQLPSVDWRSKVLEYLEFTASSDCMVYVAFDARAGALPYWLRSFEPMPATFRVTDMETFTDASNVEKLFMSVAGTNGCVYDILNDPAICDVSSKIAVDQNGPTGCARITRVNSQTNVTVSMTAQDPISGVGDMQVGTRSDFMQPDGTTPLPWLPFQPTYRLQFPPGATTVDDVNSDIAPDQPNLSTTVFFEYGGDLLIGTSTPGRVYKFDKATSGVTLLFDTGEQTVLSMMQFASYLIVGTGVNGKVFKWDGTALTQIALTGGETITSMMPLGSVLYVGSSPNGKIYEFDAQLNQTLFEDTLETAVTDFAAVGGLLFWTTMNDGVTEGEVLSTTTTLGHRHALTVPSGLPLQPRLGDVNGTTTVVESHSHVVAAGVVQPAQGHTHQLNGSRSGKVFKYDLAVDQTTIVHADRDYWVNCISATAEGLVFVGTFPNGKILRYVASEGDFIKSFDTSADMIARLRVVNDVTYAIADEEIFYFDGKRWQFLTATDGQLVDISALGQDLLLLGGKKIQVTKTSHGPDTLGVTLCAYVRFRDTVGNVTNIYKPDGTIDPCYDPCVTVGGPSGSSGTSGTSGASGASGAAILVHRLTEVDEKAKVLASMDGDESFLSGTKIEQELGIYQSEVFNGTNDLVQWQSISWDAGTQAGNSITVAVRTSKTMSGIGTAEWSREMTDPAGNDLTSLQGQFLQFRATLAVSQTGVPSPELRRVDILLRMTDSVHYFTTNFVLPDELRRGILTYNGCLNPPVTDLVFGISGLDTVDFSDYLVITPNKVFEVPTEHQTKNLRVGIKLISSPTSVPVVDEFALLFSLANDAIVRLNLPGSPGYTTPQPVVVGTTRTVVTDQVQGHVHFISFDVNLTDKSQVNATTSINSAHSHVVTSGVVQIAAGHRHDFNI